ncbi:MAG: CUB domain-containing protein, partial [Chloroflexota bacterium]
CVPVAIGYLISDGGTVNTCTARIYDTGGQGGDYSKGEDYSISFCSDDGSAVVLDFTAFEYSDGDYFYVYDGPNTSSPQLAAITNSSLIPGPFTSSGTCLTIRNVSDNNADVSDGFAANISCTPIVPGYLISDGGTVYTCGGNFFDSGGQGGNYGSTDDYTMTFCSDDGSNLQVDFSSVDIRDGDYLYVYDGTSTSDPLLATFTSTTAVQGPFTSSGTCLTFRFTADGGTTGNGFAAVISCYVDPCNPDLTAPVPDVDPLPDVTAECSVAALVAPTATDNCVGAVTGTHDATLPITAQGTTVVTWTYDDGNGNTVTQTQNVVIDDLTAPVPDVDPLPDVTAECSVAALVAPTATDNC